MPVPLGAADCARRRSGSPARISSKARSSSRGDKRGGSNRTPKEKKEGKTELDIEQWKEDEGVIEEHRGCIYSISITRAVRPRPNHNPI